MIYKKLVKNISKSGIAINGKETDLSNYYTKQEIDTQQETQDTKINDNANEIRQITNILNEAQDNITINTTNIQSNYEKIQELLKRPRFYKGQVLFFDTKQDFIDNLKTPLQLQEGVEYEVLESDRYLLIGDNGSVGGSNIINENNISLKEWRFLCTSLYVSGFAKHIPTFQNGINTSVSSSTFTSNNDISNRSGVSGLNWNINWSFGNATPQEFLPKYKEVYAIKFLRNV